MSFLVFLGRCNYFSFQSLGHNNDSFQYLKLRKEKTGNISQKINAFLHNTYVPIDVNK